MVKDIKKKCPCEGGSLPRFIQPVILDILSKEQLTGYQVIQKMDNYAMFTNEQANQTGVYRYIRFMKDNGYVIAHNLPGSSAGERLELTEAGRQCLDKWKQTLCRFRDEIDQLIDSIK